MTAWLTAQFLNLWFLLYTDVFAALGIAAGVGLYYSTKQLLTGAPSPEPEVLLAPGLVREGRR